MARSLARIVKIDAIGAIPKADAIEQAQVGGWAVVVKKGEFQAGDRAVYFEIDTFLPQGNPAWQFLIDKVPREFGGTPGAVLKTLTLRGQISQGLLLAPAALGVDPNTPVGTDLSAQLGVRKWVREIPTCLLELARGYLPSRVPSTDQERIQNLTEELAIWQAQAGRWEVSEKLEGESCTFAYTEGEFHACSRQVSFLPQADVPHNRIAAQLGLAQKLASLNQELALQGELVGPGIEGNIYRLAAEDYGFYLYDVYHIQEGRYLLPDERRHLAHKLGVAHVPIVEAAFVLDEHTGVAQLLAMADGVSALRAGQAREGLVFKAHEHHASFKAISNKYLLKQKI